MTYRRFGATSLSEPINWTIRDMNPWNLDHNIHEDWFETVDFNMATIFPGLSVFIWHYCLQTNHNKVDMSTARRRLNPPRLLSGASTHPSMVTKVNIMVMNGRLTSLSFHANKPTHCRNNAISKSDLETWRSWSWVWSKGKVKQSDQYRINSLPFHFTPIRQNFLR